MHGGQVPISEHEQWNCMTYSVEGKISSIAAVLVMLTHSDPEVRADIFSAHGSKHAKLHAEVLPNIVRQGNGVGQRGSVQR